MLPCSWNKSFGFIFHFCLFSISSFFLCLFLSFSSFVFVSAFYSFFSFSICLPFILYFFALILFLSLILWEHFSGFKCKATWLPYPCLNFLQHKLKDSRYLSWNPVYLHADWLIWKYFFKFKQPSVVFTYQGDTYTFKCYPWYMNIHTLAINRGNKCASFYTRTKVDQNENKDFGKHK